MKKSTWLLVAAILVVIVGIVGIVNSVRSKDQIQQTGVTAQNENSETTIAPVIAGWKTYLNTHYSYAIDYPADWTFRQFPNGAGAGFRPLNSPADTSSEVVTIMETGRAISDCSIPFPEYMKIVAIHNIQDYVALYSLKGITAKSNITGYTSTWLTTQLGTGKQNVAPSLPLTFFDDPTQACGNGTGLIMVELGNTATAPIYTEMLSSFRFAS